MKRLFFLLVCTLLVATIYSQNMAEAEYFFDNDPGIGNGVAISFSPSDTIDLNISLDGSGLSAGFHTLFLRARDVNGVWGLYAARTFRVDEDLQGFPLSETEYFFDNDPGTGNGQNLMIPPGDSADVIASFSTGSLLPGFHTLHFRAKNQDGIWGGYLSRVFFIQDIAESQPGPSITAAEFFIDDDPGTGNGIAIPVSTTDSLNTVFSAATQFLSEGFHTLFFRQKNAKGAWGNTEGRTFYVQRPDTIDKSLVRISWYFDGDEAAAQSMAVNSGDSLNQVFVWPTAPLTDGSHALHVQVEDAQGVVSMVRVDSFTIGQTGIEQELFARDLLFYPNPVQTQLRITTQGHVFTAVRITDMMGKQVFQTPVQLTPALPLTLPVGHLPEGIYLMSLRENDSGIWVSRRMIKSR